MTLHDLDHSIRQSLAAQLDALGFESMADKLQMLPPLNPATLYAYRLTLAGIASDLEEESMPGHGDVNRVAISAVQDAIANLHEHTT